LTPVIIGLLLKGEHHGNDGSGNWSARFERGFELFRRGYVRILTMLLKRRGIVPVVAALMLALGGVMFTEVGRDFFRTSTPYRSSSTFALRRRPASRPPSASSRKSRTRSARSSQHATAT
jgi:multidrug efflux pump subunit AcrB